LLVGWLVGWLAVDNTTRRAALDVRPSSHYRSVARVLDARRSLTRCTRMYCDACADGCGQVHAL